MRRYVLPGKPVVVWRRMLLAGALLAAGPLLAGTGSAAAQRVAPPRGHFGFSFLAADPVGELGTFFDQGFGLQFDGAVAMAAEGHLRLRGDLGFVIYGHERQGFCYATPIGCRIGLDLTTTNSILFAGLGPELVFAAGAVEPYAHATVGVSYFATTSALSGADAYDDFGQTTNYSDAVLAYTLGGGLRMALRRGRKPIYLDLAVERHQNGVVDFLTEGDIVDHPDGSITVFPNRSEANLVAFRLGMSFGIAGGRERR